jgi:hypothetical protein
MFNLHHPEDDLQHAFPNIGRAHPRYQLHRNQNELDIDD